MPEAYASPPAAAALSVDSLKVHFPIHKGVMGAVAGYVKAVDGVSFEVKRGEVFALVGESGCGKTTAAKAVLGLAPVTSGSVQLALGRWRDHPVSWHELGAKERRELRRQVQLVFQDPYSSLDPRMTVRQILDEPLRVHGLDRSDSQINALLEQVGLPPSYAGRFPHEFSGGQQQRIGIARALATGPEMIVADEPVSSLDVSIRAQIINLLDDLRQQFHQSLLFISHDLAVVRHITNRMAVMYLGRIMEMGTGDQIYDNPQHPYTHALLASVPVPGIGRRTKDAVAADEKTPGESKGCPFYPRCTEKSQKCLEDPPQLKDIGSGHMVACLQR